MNQNLKKPGTYLSLLFLFYSFLSFLIFLRDDFILERISFLTQKPQLLTTGRQLAKTLHVNSIPTPLFFLTIVLMFIVYIKTLRLLKNQPAKKGASKTVMLFSGIFLIATIFSFPALSTDVFDYISSNRVLYVHDENPWLHPPQNFPDDEFIYLGSWKFRASIYGPVQFLFSSFVHFAARDNIIINILGFKLMHSAFLIATILALQKFLEKHFPSRQTYGLALFAWNPLVWIEIAGNAHNDIIMAFFTIVGVYFAFENKFVKAAVFFSFAILAKVAAIIYIPLVALWIINKNKQQLARFIITLLAAITVGFMSLGEGFWGFISNIGVQLGLYLRSLPTILRFLFLKIGINDTQAALMEKLFTIPPFAFLYIKILKKLKEEGVVASMVAVMIIYLMIASPMLQPWYIIWFLPLAALLKPGKLQNVTIVFSFTSIIYYTVLFTSFYFNPLNFIWQITMFVVIVIPPLLLWVTPKNWYTRISRAFLIDN